MTDSDDWKKVKNFVGGKKPQPTDPLADAIKTHGPRQAVNMDEGGVVPGDGGEPPADFMPDPLQMAVGKAIAGGLGAPPRAPAAPVQRPTAPQPPTMAGKPPEMGLPGAQPPSGEPPALDPASMERASGVLGGITPEMIQNLYAKYARPTTGQEIGEGVAGLGDAIASVGQRTPGALKTAREEIGGARDRALALPTAMAAAGKEQLSLSKELQGDDPNSPLSRAAQRTYAPNLKTLGFTDQEIQQMPLSLISDATKTGADIGKIKMEMRMKTIELGQHQQEIEETGRHNVAMEKEEGAKTGTEAAKALADQGLYKRAFSPGRAQNKLEETAGISGPHGPSVVQRGHTYNWNPETGKYE